jgi:hypothetical protein
MRRSYFGSSFLTVLGLVFVAAPLFSGNPFRLWDFSSMSGLAFLCFGLVLGFYQYTFNSAARRAG